MPEEQADMGYPPAEPELAQVIIADVMAEDACVYHAVVRFKDGTPKIVQVHVGAYMDDATVAGHCASLGETLFVSRDWIGAAEGFIKNLADNPEGGGFLPKGCIHKGVERTSFKIAPEARVEERKEDHADKGTTGEAAPVGSESHLGAGEGEGKRDPGPQQAPGQPDPVPVPG